MFDAIVIGAGPGGYVAAIRLAQLYQNQNTDQQAGPRVAIIEKEAMGGVCLNWGCIPSKALIHVASLYEELQHASSMGLHAENIRLDVSQLQTWKQGVVKKLTGGIEHLLKSNQVAIIKGTAQFTDAHTLQVTAADGQTQTVTGKAFILATGSSPIAIPGFSLNNETIVDSRDALNWTEVPKRLAVLGGGVIGLEMGVLYAKLGSQVTVIEMAPQLLPGVDAEIAQILSRLLKKRGLKLHTQSRALQAETTGKTVQLTFENEKKATETLEVDRLLVSVGRKPNSQGLGLEKIGVKLNEKGFVQVDHQLRSSVRHIFAIGDLAGGPLLAHKASKEGLIAADVIAGKPEVVDYRAMPAAIFTDPEIATVGLTEQQAIEMGLTVRIGKFPFQASGRALSMNQADGLVKIVADAKTDEVLGVHMVGPHVSELIGEAALAIEMGATAEDIALTVHTHPTLPEALMEAAEAVHGKAIHIYQPPAVSPKPGLAVLGTR